MSSVELLKTISFSVSFSLTQLTKILLLILHARRKAINTSFRGKRKLSFSSRNLNSMFITILSNKTCFFQFYFVDSALGMITSAFCSSRKFLFEYFEIRNQICLNDIVIIKKVRIASISAAMKSAQAGLIVAKVNLIFYNIFKKGKKSFIKYFKIKVWLHR